MKIDDNIIQMEARTAASVPTPPAGIVYQFLDTVTGHYSQKDSAGTVTDLGAAGGGGGSGIDYKQAFSMVSLLS